MGPPIGQAPASGYPTSSSNPTHPPPANRFGEGPRSPGVPAPTMSSVEAHAEFAGSGSGSGLSRGDTIKAKTRASNSTQQGRASAESDRSGASASAWTAERRTDGVEVLQPVGPVLPGQQVKTAASSMGSGQTGSRFFAKRDRQRSHEELRAVGLDVEQANVQGSEASASSNTSSSFFPFFGRRKDTSTDRRTASQPISSKSKPQANDEPALSDASPQASVSTGPAPPRLSTGSEGSTTGKRRLIHLQDVVAQRQQQQQQQENEQEELQRAKTPTPPNEDAAGRWSSGTGGEKHLPPLPIPMPMPDEMPSPPREIVVTPSSPAGPPLGAPSWSAGATAADMQEAVTSTLDRQRTLRAAGKAPAAQKQSPQMLAGQADDDRRPRLRHVKSLGLGKPSLDRGVSDTPTIRPSEKALIKEAYGAPRPHRLGDMDQAGRSTSSILLQPQAAFASGSRSRSPSPASGAGTPGGARSISFTSPVRPSRVPDWKTASSDDLAPTYKPGARRILRKARSYSGIFSSMEPVASTALAQEAEPSIAPSRPGEVLQTDTSGTADGKRSRATSGSLLKGAADWFGLRKGKRKGSGAKTPPAPLGDARVAPVPPVPPVPSLQVSGRSQSTPLAIPGADRRTSESGPLAGGASAASSQAEGGRSWLSFKSRSRRSTLVSASRPGSIDSGGSLPRRTSTLDIQEYGTASGAQSPHTRSPSPSPGMALTPYEQTASPPSVAILPLPPVNVPSPMDATYFSSFRLHSASSSSEFGVRREHRSGQLEVGSLRGQSGRETPATISEFGQLSSAEAPSNNSTVSVRNRPRAHSDVRQPTRNSAVSTAEGGQEKDISQLFGGGSSLNRRPTLGSRSNSASSAISRAVKTAITPGRGRSGSLLRRDTSDGVTGEAEMARTVSTASLLSSAGRMSRQPSSEHGFTTGPPGTWQRTSARFLVPESPAYSAFTDDGVPRSSFSGSMASSVRSAQDATQPRRHSTQTEDAQGKAPDSKSSGRQRALTVSAVSAPKQAPSAGPLQSLRKRPGSARRLSLGMFGPSPGTSPLASSTPTFSSGGLQNIALEQPRGLSEASKSVIPDFDPDFSPTEWLSQLASRLSRSDVANVLASKPHSTYIEALRLFMAEFDFRQDPLDIALRRLLMVVALPKETQQIDRVIEAFAKQYVECQPDLYRDPDHAYVLAFSLMMLHTDVFNRNNKNKMSKADYAKNTRLDGVPPIVLEIFYDNISYTPFVYTDEDVTGDSGSPMTATTSPVTLKNGRLDIYAMISTGTLRNLRVALPALLKADEPFAWHGTQPFDHAAILGRIASAPRLSVAEGKARRRSGATMLPQNGKLVPGASERPEGQNSLNLSVINVGLLSRKDDLLEGGKKATSRKWKSWSVILTTSQLILMKDTTWASSLLDQIATPAIENGAVLQPRVPDFKPDEVFPLKMASALFDGEYAKYPHTFRLVLAEGRQFLLQAPDELAMNEWISHINFAAAYRTTSLEVRPTALSAAPLASSDSGTAAEEGKSTASTSQMEDVLLSERSAPRPDCVVEAYVQPKLLELQQLADPLVAKVSENKRVARNMAILIAFQKSGRDRIEAALRTLAERTHHTQLELARLRAWSGVLEAGLAKTDDRIGRDEDSIANRQGEQSSDPTSPHLIHLDRRSNASMTRATSTSSSLGSRYLDRPPIPHRSSSASFHTAWEKEVASPNNESGSTALPETGVTDTLQDDGSAEAEDWQSMLSGDQHRRRQLAEVPEEGLRKLSLRIKRELPE